MLVSLDGNNDAAGFGFNFPISWLSLKNQWYDWTFE